MEKPRRYKHSTPVGRLRRNASKIAWHTSLVQTRLRSWNGTSDKRVVAARIIADEIMTIAARLDDTMKALEQTNFTPPRRSSALRYSVGQHVAISPKYKHKYGLVFAQALKIDQQLLNDLVISNILPSGEVVVQKGQRSPFVVAKSHLVLIREK